MTPLKTIQLDTMEPADPHFTEWLAANDITMKVIDAANPATGFPLVEYTGEYEQLLKMVAFFFAEDLEEAQGIVDDYLAWAADHAEGLPDPVRWLRSLADADRSEPTPTFNSAAAHQNAYWH